MKYLLNFALSGLFLSISNVSLNASVGVSFAKSFMNTDLVETNFFLHLDVKRRIELQQLSVSVRFYDGSTSGAWEPHTRDGLLQAMATLTQQIDLSLDISEMRSVQKMFNLFFNGTFEHYIIGGGGAVCDQSIGSHQYQDSDVKY